MTTLLIERPKARWVDLLRAYRIEVDGAVRGRIRHGGTLALDCAPGLRRVQARIDWTGSLPVLVDLVEGETFEMVVFPTRSALAVGMMGGAFARDYLTLVPKHEADLTRTSLAPDGDGA